MPRDTRTRFEAVYARHKQHCAGEQGAECDCSPAFYGVVYDRSTGRKRKTTMAGSPTAARDLRADLDRALRAGVRLSSGSGRVSEAIDSFLTAAGEGVALNKHGRPYKPSALRSLRGALRGHVQPQLGARRLADVRRRDVQLVVDQLTPTHSGSSVRNVVHALRSLYAWADDRELAGGVDPSARVRLPAVDATPRDRVATVDEMRRLLDALDSEDALPFAIAAYSGARRNEIRHLRGRDVDLAAGVLSLGADARVRKSRVAHRVVPIVQPLRWLLKDVGPSELVCPPHHGRASGLSFEALQQRADARWVVAGLTRITPHECRHTFVSWLDAAGVRQSVTSKLAGHAMGGDGAQVTGRYTHQLPDDLERAGALLDAYLAD